MSLEQTELFTAEELRLPHNQKEAFIYFLERMDLESIEALLDGEMYMDLPKAIFIKKIERVIGVMQGMGDTELKAMRGVCLGKPCKHFYDRGMDMVGNKSGFRFSIVISSSEGIITDITECRRFINPKIPNYDVRRVSMAVVRD